MIQEHAPSSTARYTVIAIGRGGTMGPTAIAAPVAPIVLLANIRRRSIANANFCSRSDNSSESRARRHARKCESISQPEIPNNDKEMTATAIMVNPLELVHDPL